jgi:hypothetical protein
MKFVLDIKDKLLNSAIKQMKEGNIFKKIFL